jgi:LysM repeat protein
MTQNKALTLTKTADLASYNSLNQQVIYSYVITNSGNVTLGPVQFVINDDKISTPVNCGSADANPAPNTTVTCSATYTITQADLDAGSVTSNATATDGTTTSPSIVTTLNKDTTSSLQLVVDPNLKQNSTISHSVVKGEWLWQIARCYGADPKQAILSNSQLSDPAKIDPGITVTVPNIGSERTIYGPQTGDDQIKSCVPTYEVQSGDTWENIAAKFKASPSLLREVNSITALSPGIRIRVPINSVGD